MAISVNAMEAKLRKYEAMARAATKQLQESRLSEFKVVAVWDSENGVDTFYLKSIEDEDAPRNWIELRECRHCQCVMELASDAIALASSWGF